MIFDLHIHTVNGSSDSSLTPDVLLEKSKNIGLTGVCLTEHSANLNISKVINDFEKSGITLLRGLEVSTDMGHILVFGLYSYVSGMHKIKNLRKIVDDVGGIMISAHPFRNLFSLPNNSKNFLYPDKSKYPLQPIDAIHHPIFNIVDEVEILNGANTTEENNFAIELAKLKGFIGTGGSDAHSFHGVAKYVTYFENDIYNEKDLICAIKNKKFKAGTLNCKSGFNDFK
ncbi:MAG: hypothetical protein CL758_05290 [Chloroflexi bacterium]|nr:hypothetical protein [Chloroflexota bacterium]|tara:strand:+ start:17150 stop:17833 length:684 start_codon:yes stop_codon:yes gene_type:complete